MIAKASLNKLEENQNLDIVHGVANPPLVSICIQTYQHADFISECLDRILEQKTTFRFEIILGEDDSTDGTREICIEYAEKYPTLIRLFLRKRSDVIYINGRPTGRYNFLENLKAAKGKYIALCEGDDFWTDQLKLQKQVDFLSANKEYSICFHNVKIIGNKKPKNVDLYSDFSWSNIDLKRNIYEVEDLLAGPLIPTCSVVFQNNLPKNIPNWLYKVASGDMALFLLIVEGKKIRFFNEIMGCYRKHGGGITKDHKHDWIHMNRIFMYKKLRYHFYQDYSVIINRLIRYHRNQIRDPFNKLRSKFI